MKGQAFGVALPTLIDRDADGAAALAAFLLDCQRRGLRPVTLRDRGRIIEMFGRSIDPAPLLQVTVPIAEQWRASMDHLSAATINAYTSHVSGFYRWALRRGLVATDPTCDIPVPKVRAGLPHPIEEDDLELALATAGQPLRAWLVLAGYAGLRAGEIARMRREHVLDTRTPALIHVVNGKGGRERVVPAGSVVLAELAQHLTGRRGRLWLENSTHPERILSSHVSQHLRQLGIPHTCHSLRHRFATQLYQRSGGDLRLTQDMLGHSSPATTAIYAAWDPGRAATVLDDLAGSLGKAGPLGR